MNENVTVVTGASKGIGKTISHSLAKAGHRLALISRDSDGDLSNLATELSNMYGADVIYIPTDVSNKPKVSSAFSYITKNFGKPSLLITSAGMNIYKPANELTEKEKEIIWGVNYRGAVNCFDSFLNNTDEGHIVAISSISALASKIKGRSLLEILFGVGKELRESYRGPWGHEEYAEAKYLMGEKLKKMVKDNKKIKTTIVYPGIVSGTNFFLGNTEYIFPRKMLDDSSITTQEVADEVMKAIEHPKKEVFIPRHYQILRPLSVVAPGFARKKVWKESDTDAAYKLDPRRYAS